jgi:hypothetical protein
MVSAARGRRAETAWYLRQNRRRRGVGRGWLVVLAIALLFIAALWLLRTKLPAGFGPSGRPTAATLMPSVKAFEFYFGDPSARGLQREIRYLVREEDRERQMKSVMAALLAGSLSGGVTPWPESVTVRAIFVTSGGIAYVDFDETLRAQALPGDYAEWLIAASLTRTLCANFPEVRGVRILVNGEARGAIARTLPLERTYTPAMFDDAG